MEEKIYRIIDVNFNRLREGLRVCEDILRFLIPEPEIALELKNLRRSASRIVQKLGIKMLVQARDTIKDKNKFKLAGSKDKISYQDLLIRNFQRATEALRVLEEVSQVIEPKLKSRFMRLRFKTYRLEKKFLDKK